ncbi:SdpA family antimicrobial peptide system protein [Leifsonia sp. NCR5]|uniref:SdpA family antimicrobial peptide system protein n=1 Tax=Leifsonia sp. NCR5 TaxID=1978342 RepID=UPI0015C44B4A|nr:SdpA family antimicrobial peptide system protein [Leifsonia sp. NCR5]
MAWGGLSVFFSLPDNVLSSPDPGHRAIRAGFATIFPQSWGFFTNPPQTEELGIYTSTTFASLLQTPQNRVENAFGLSRAQRAQGPEVALLAEEVKSWKKCDLKQTRLECLVSASRLEAQVVDRDIRYRTICGLVVVAKEPYTPFEYRDFDLPDHTIDSYARLDVRCH